MARYVATIETHYKQPIPYHFTCNYCGEVNQKTFEITVSLNASGSARNVSGVQQLAGQQHEKQVRKAVREKNRAIEKYRKKLSMGKVAKNEFWWNGTNIGHDNANAVVFVCQNHGGQPASLEEALRFKQDHTVKPENHGCDLLHLAS